MAHWQRQKNKNKKQNKKKITWVSKKIWANAKPSLGDNQAMYTLVTQEGATTRTRYYERATLLIKRAIIMLLLAPYLIKTQFMIADMFTKALDKASFIKFRDVIMNNHVSLKETIAAAACKLNGNVRRLADHLYEHL